jgi:hypothetical protein
MRALACCEEILREKKSLSSQNSVLDFFKSSSGFHASPPVLLYNGYDDPDDLLLVLVEFPSPGIVIFNFTYFTNFINYVFSII